MSTRSSLLCLILLATAASAADLIVTVTGAPAGKGEVACALFRSADGFPMNSAKAVASTRVKAAPEVECRFKDVSPGPLAVAVSVDLNGNGKTDKNLLGIPTEPWGVSNNARPSMRAPKFEEARVAMSREDRRIAVKVAK